MTTSREGNVPSMTLRDLVGYGEIAERLSVAPKSVRQWRERYSDFPEPRLTISGTPVWLWPDVERWHRLRDSPVRHIAEQAGQSPMPELTNGPNVPACEHEWGPVSAAIGRRGCTKCGKLKP